MNKKEIIAKMKVLSKEITDLVNSGKLDDAQAKRTEYDNLQNQLTLIDGLMDPETAQEPQNNAASGQNDAQAADPVNMQHGTLDMSTVQVLEPTGKKKKELAIHNFAEAARHRFTNLVEGTGANGGYLVPEDIQTMINQYLDAEFSLRDYIDSENVTTDKGARTYQKKKETSGLTLVDEGGTIGALTEPEFERLAYNIKEYAGYIPVSNDLLNDSDQNVADVVTRWIAKNKAATINNLVLAILKTKTPTAFADLKAVKSAMNKTLGQAYKPFSSILTNDDGLDYFDNLVDTMGRPILNPDPTAPANLRLRAGATVVPMVIAPNSTLATDTTKMPVICGALKEAVKIFDRNQTEILASNVASIGSVNAFAQNLTLYRVIARMDIVQKDVNSWVYGQITQA